MNRRDFLVKIALDILDAVDEIDSILLEKQSGFFGFLKRVNPLASATNQGIIFRDGRIPVGRAGAVFRQGKKAVSGAASTVVDAAKDRSRLIGEIRDLKSKVNESQKALEATQQRLVGSQRRVRDLRHKRQRLGNWLKVTGGLAAVGGAGTIGAGAYAYSKKKENDRLRNRNLYQRIINR